MKDLKIGDKVEKVINTILPEKLVKKIKESDCGCEKRKEWLNDLTKTKE